MKQNKRFILKPLGAFILSIAGVMSPLCLNAGGTVSVPSRGINHPASGTIKGITPLVLPLRELKEDEQKADGRLLYERLVEALLDRSHEEGIHLYGKDFPLDQMGALKFLYLLKKVQSDIQTKVQMGFDKPVRSLRFDHSKISFLPEVLCEALSQHPNLHTFAITHTQAPIQSPDRLFAPISIALNEETNSFLFMAPEEQKELLDLCEDVVSLGAYREIRLSLEAAKKWCGQSDQSSRSDQNNLYDFLFKFKKLFKFSGKVIDQARKHESELKLLLQEIEAYRLSSKKKDAYYRPHKEMIHLLLDQPQPPNGYRHMRHIARYIGESLSYEYFNEEDNPEVVFNRKLMDILNIDYAEALQAAKIEASIQGLQSSESQGSYRPVDSVGQALNTVVDFERKQKILKMVQSIDSAILYPDSIDEIITSALNEHKVNGDIKKVEKAEKAQALLGMIKERSKLPLFIDKSWLDKLKSEEVKYDEGDPKDAPSYAQEMLGLLAKSQLQLLDFSDAQAGSLFGQLLLSLSNKEEAAVASSKSAQMEDSFTKNLLKSAGVIKELDPRSKTLEKLHLAGNQFDGSVTVDLEYLRFLYPNLTVLDLSFNPLGVHAGKFIAKGLVGNKTLRELYLRKVGMGSDGANDLMQALFFGGNSLECFDLSDNRIRNGGSTLIEDGLKANSFEQPKDEAQNQSLKTLILRNCEIDQTFLTRILWSIKKSRSKSLERVDLKGNPLVENYQIEKWREWFKESSLKKTEELPQWHKEASPPQPQPAPLKWTKPSPPESTSGKVNFNIVESEEEQRIYVHSAKASLALPQFQAGPISDSSTEPFIKQGGGYNMESSSPTESGSSTTQEAESMDTDGSWQAHIENLEGHDIWIQMDKPSKSLKLSEPLQIRK